MSSKSIKIGLEAIGLQNNQHLKSALINCDDPLKAISDFQEENSIQLPTLKPALNLLDLHTIKRLDFHLSIAEELKENLLKRVEELAAKVKEQTKDPGSESLKKLEDLLDKTFPLISMPRLTNLVLLIMKSLPKINPCYLNYINENESLYTIAPIEVKRQIWCLNSDVFVKELQPLFEKITAYFDDLVSNFEHSTTSLTSSTISLANIDSAIIKENLLINSTAYTSMLKGNKKLSALITDIIKLVGNNAKLYQYSLSTLSKMFLKNYNWFYATLRSQLLFKLNETNNQDLVSGIMGGGQNDPQTENVFKFASIINMCLKERRIDTKRAKELETIMESKKFEKIIPDVAFILSDPFVLDMLARNALCFLNKCVQNELLPRNCTELIFALRLLYLSLYAKEIMKSSSYKEPNLNGNLITEYLPNIAYFITDFYEKLYDDSLETLTNQSKNLSLGTSSLLNTTSPTILSTPSNTMTTNTPPAVVKKSPPIVLKISTRKLEILSAIKVQIGENQLCSVLFLYLIIACIEIHDWINLRVLLPALKYPDNNVGWFEKWFMCHLFSMLTDRQNIEQFGQDWFVTLIFEEYLFVTLEQKDSQLAIDNKQTALLNSSNHLYEQVYKLIDKVFPAYLSATSFCTIIEAVKPKKYHSSSVHITYLKLKEKSDDSTHSHSEQPEPVDTDRN